MFVGFQHGADGIDYYWAPEAVFGIVLVAIFTIVHGMDKVLVGILEHQHALRGQLNLLKHAVAAFIGSLEIEDMIEKSIELIAIGEVGVASDDWRRIDTLSIEQTVKGIEQTGLLVVQQTVGRLVVLHGIGKRSNLGSIEAIDINAKTLMGRHLALDLEYSATSISVDKHGLLFAIAQRVATKDDMEIATVDGIFLQRMILYNLIETGDERIMIDSISKRLDTYPEYIFISRRGVFGVNEIEIVGTCLMNLSRLPIGNNLRLSRHIANKEQEGDDG